MIHIRHAVPEDRAFLLTAVRRLASFGPPPWRAPEEIVAGEERTLRTFFESPPDGSALLVADEGQASLGFAYLERVQDYFTQTDHGHLGMLVVTEEAEGRGVGGALVRAALGWARDHGFGKLTLTVFEANQAARAVYEHLGFVAETLRYVKVL